MGTGGERKILRFAQNDGGCAQNDRGGEDSSLLGNTNYIPHAKLRNNVEESRLRVFYCSWSVYFHFTELPTKLHQGIYQVSTAKYQFVLESLYFLYVLQAFL
jgi:hypothetical protein